MHNVFVYGTLRIGEPNHHVLEDSKYIGKTITPEGMFILRDLGPFPAAEVVEMVWTPPIVGEVYEVDDRVLKRLDVLEGVDSGFYRRILVGTPLGECWIYVMDDVDDEWPIISNGDWVRRYE